ncbi:MAG: 30S ribosomal protein S17 [Candidatus Taylorbacteria bacterium]|nr:30S ribosomal protein S17 [Candidatus Taylorbacteria bacterium]
MAIFGKKTTEHKETKAAAPAKAGAVSRPKQLTGIVVSTKMKDTVVVKVDRFEKAPKYQRYMKISKKYKAHDAGNTKKEGEKVTIIETKPYSKDKHFRVA